MPPGEALRLFPSAGPRASLAKALCELAPALPGLSTLLLFDGAFGAGGRHPILAARFANGVCEAERRRALAAPSAVARPHVDAGTTFDVVQLPDELEETVAAVAHEVWRRP